MLRQALAMVVLAAVCSNAHAQTLRLALTGTLESVPLTPVLGARGTLDVTARVYFDPASAPSGQDGDTTIFPLEYVEFDITHRATGKTRRVVFSDDSRFVGSVRSDPSDALFTGRPTFTIIFGGAGAGTPGVSATGSLSIVEPAGHPGPNPTQLPSSPSGYNGAGNVFLEVNVEDGEGVSGISSVWVPTSSLFTGGTFSYTVSSDDPPTPPAPEACSPADLDVPFGALDFSDVLAFLVAFGAGCP